MAYRYLQVDTLICDNCGKETHRVLTDDDEQTLPDYMEWDFFRGDLEKQGWVFAEQTDGPEIACCSETYYKKFIAE